MSNSPNNPEQSTLFVQTPNQLNTGLAKATDFKIDERDGGQRGDTKAERAAVLADADSDGKRLLGTPIPDRNEVPRKSQRS